MLLLLYLTNTNYINKYVVIISLILMSILGFYFPPIVVIYVIDIYLYMLRTNFLMTTSIKVNKIPSVSMDITAEGIKKEDIDLRSLLIEYSKKFDPK